MNKERFLIACMECTRPRADLAARDKNVRGTCDVASPMSLRIIAEIQRSRTRQSN